jgi:acyl-CoA reductase-like NAD-dependent aldehyde dehydrogenase
MKSESKKKRVPSVEDAETVNLTGLEDLEEALASAKRSALTGRVTGRDANGARVRVNKAYKMFVGGAFVRSESGRYFQVRTGTEEAPDPAAVNVPLGSRKDGRDAVLAAKNASDGWAARTAYNRGQILYRLAEVMESRREELVVSLVRGGEEKRAAAAEVDVAIDRAVFYAGFCDKYQSLVASSNPVSGPHFGFSVPEPMGVVALVAPSHPALLGLVSTILPVIAGGNTAVLVAGEEDPRTAIVFCECLATSDLPGGVVNVLTGRATEIAPHLAKHREVIALDAWTNDAALRQALEREGSDNVKRVKTHAPLSAASWADERKGQGIGWIERFLETKTVWHPVGV